MSGHRSPFAWASAVITAVAMFAAPMTPVAASPWQIRTFAPPEGEAGAATPEEAESPPDSSGAGAEVNDAPSRVLDESEADPEVVALKEMYDEADVAFLAGRYRDAAAKFDEGYGRGGMVAFLFNAAVAWERAGQMEQAAERYAEYLVKAPDAADNKEIADRLALIRAAIEGKSGDAIEQVSTKGIAVITSKPSRAEIRLDDPEGPVFAITPFRGTLPAGDHVIHITSPGYKPMSQAVPDTQGKMIIMPIALSEKYFLGQIEVEAELAGADVYLRQISDPEGKAVPASKGDEVPVGKTPFSNQIPPGKWEVRVEKLGYKQFKEEIEVVQGEVATMRYVHELIGNAILDLKTATAESVGAIAYLDKEELCTLPCQEEVSPGEHTVTIRKKKKKTLEFQVAVQRADLVTVNVTMEPATKRYGAIVTGLLMGASAGVGTYFAVQAQNLREELETDRENFEQFDTEDTRRERGFRDAIIADSMFGVTVVLGALTLFYLLRETGDPSQGEKEQTNLAKRTTIAPYAGRYGAGFATEVRF